MSDVLLSAEQAAQRLGVSKTTFRGWLGRSDVGALVIRARPVTIVYYQGGPKGQGRIKIEAKEVERIKDLMRVRPRALHPRRHPTQRLVFPEITAKLGTPDQ